MRRPLFAALAGIAAAVWLTVLLIPWSLRNYEPLRGSRLFLDGTVCGLESKREGDSIVWRMMLSDVSRADNFKDFGIRTGEYPGTSRDDGSTGGPTSGDPEHPLGGPPDRNGRVLCILDQEPRVDVSARVRLSGTLYPFQRAMNDGEFDLRLYYHILRIEYSLRDVEILAASAPADPAAASLYRVKKSISTLIDRCFSTKNSPVLKAMLLGEKGLLEEETKDLYQGAGMIHILSISGVHLSLLGMGLFSLSAKLRIPLPARGTLSILTVILYGKMVGMGTSVFRALVMLSLYILSKVIGRTYDLLTASGIACVLLLLDQPLYLYHTGFLFSFAAVLSMGLLLPALPGKTLKSLAIPLGTLPVYLWTYGTFPVYSLLLNLIVLPLMTVVMISGGAAVLVGAVSVYYKMLGCGLITPGSGGLIQPSGGTGAATSIAGFITRAAGLPAELILDLYRFLAEISQKLPGHEIVIGRPSAFQIVVYYAMLLALAAFSSWLQLPSVRKKVENPDEDYFYGSIIKDAQNMYGLPNKKGLRNILTIHQLLKDRLVLPTLKARMIGIVRIMCTRFNLRDNRERRHFAMLCASFWITISVLILAFHSFPAFEMDFLYVGQGDGIYIGCGNRHFLIDGGSSTKQELAKYTLLPFLHCRGVGRLDGVILTHEDGDHSSGLLEFLENAAAGHEQIRIGSVWLPDIAEKAKGEKYHRIEELCEQLRIPVTYISRGQRLRAGTLTMDCLHPAKGAAYASANEYSTTLLLRYEGRGEGRDISKMDSENQQEHQEGTEDIVKNKEQPNRKNSRVFTALLTGDLEGQGETDLLSWLDEMDMDHLHADVLKIAHHGSKNATTGQFLETVRADLAVISAGINNIYGHPSSETLRRLDAAGIPYLCTINCGQISVHWKAGRIVSEGKTRAVCGK